ncbi:tetratricopeptide repeat protein [Novosphingobium percolationis]|uniref:tetratricopeptide repeat protein n=1 Tax=Novosphingobium percolationis TaxID=2871811 RepID=UPI001CD75B3D|nr:hypothetical protein [Novosphingobium percolationis]
MTTIFRGRAARAALALGLMATATPMALPTPAMAQAQDPAEARLRKIEAELRAVQRKVFPDGAGKTFGPEITAPQVAPAAPVGAPASTPVADLLARMDAVEAQLQRLTAASEEGQNRMTKLEARIAALEPPPPAATAPAAAESAPALSPVPAAAAPMATKPASTGVAKPAPAPTTRPAPPLAPKPVGAPADRVAAVEAIAKPSTGDAGEDEYSYGYRLWEAKFFPEAQQQLTRTAEQYPKHKRISYVRNLLGRAYLDDNKPGTAAQWFLQNYQSDKQGERAADSLLYLGVAMAKLKETRRACVAFAEFRNVYPAEAAGRLKSQLDAASKAVTCN